MYVEQKLTYPLPEQLYQNFKLTFNLKKLPFIKYYKQNFLLIPTPADVGNYTIILNLELKEANSEPFLYGIRVRVLDVSQNPATQKCPSTVKKCQPWISKVTEKGIALVNFPYQLKVPSK